MLLVRNAALTQGGASPIAANFPSSPQPMGGSSLLVAFVNVQGGPATSITPPPDITLRAAATPQIAHVASLSITVPTSTKVGDLIVVQGGMETSGAFTSDPTSSGFTLIVGDTTQFRLNFYYKVATLADIGATLTFTFSSAQWMKLGCAVFFSASGGSVMVDTGVNANKIASGNSSTLTAPVVTTTGNNTLQLVAAHQEAGAAFTAPAGWNTVYNDTGNCIGMFSLPQVTAGASAAATISSAASALYEVGQLTLTSGGVGSPWTSAGAAITNGTTVQQAFMKPAAGDLGIGRFSWSGVSTYSEVFIIEIYSSQGSVPTLGTYATNTGTGTAATFPSPTLTQASELLLGCVFLAANTNIIYPGSTAFASGFGGGTLTIFDNLNSSAQSCVAYFGCSTTSLPATMPATGWSGSQAWCFTVLPIKEATAGDPVITGVSIIDNVAGAFAPANLATFPVVPPTAQANDIVVACVAQGKVTGSQATGQTVAVPDVEFIFQGPTGQISTFTLPASGSGVKVGDLMIAALGGGSPTPPAGWTLIGTDSSQFQQNWYSRVVVLADFGTTWNWGGGGAGISVTVWRSLSGATINIGATSFTGAASAASASAGNLTVTRPSSIIIAQGFCLSGTVTNPADIIGVNQFASIFNGGFYVGPTSGLTPGQTWTTTSANQWELGQIELYTTSTLPWTHIRQDNEPLSTFSLDLFWGKVANNLVAGILSTFYVPNASGYIQGQIISIGNLNASPIDDHQGASGVGNGAEWGTPVALNVKSTTGFLLYFWGSNFKFDNSSNNLPILPPAAIVADTIGTSGGGGPVRFFRCGLGTVDMAESPQYCEQGTSDGFGHFVNSATASNVGWATQVLALKAASGPVRPTTNLQIDSVMAVVMGSSVAAGSSGWFWSINPFQM